MKNIVIVGAARTAIGSFNGGLSHLPAPRIAEHVISDVLLKANVKKEEISEVVMGCVLTAGIGQAPARQASLFADIPSSVPCTTIGKVCGSGLAAVAFGAKSILCADDEPIVVAGGMENMSLAPHLLEKSRKGYRLGDATISDSMIKDGLWDVYHQFHMGKAAELCVKKYGFSREAQDEYAIQSYERAITAQKNGSFKKEISPVILDNPRGNSTVVLEDEEPLKFNKDKMRELSPAFDKCGSITAANASKINDGAAALVLMSEAEAKKRGIKPLGKIVGYAEAAQDPAWFTTAPLLAIQKVLKKCNLKTTDIDLFEINEAFAAVAMAAIQTLSLSREKVNIHGGAVALGHPIGASGARLLTTLLYAMIQRNVHRGLVSLCIGGGEANAMIIERTL